MAGPSVTPTSAEVVVRDSEVMDTLKAFTSYGFDPAPSGLKRLDQFSKMYERYRIVSMTIRYQPTTGVQATGGCYLGIAPGPVLAAVKDKSDILRLKPSTSGTAYTPHRLVYRQAMPQKWLYCRDGSRDGMAFTLYTGGEAEGGSLVVDYHVIFDGPRPF